MVSAGSGANLTLGLGLGNAQFIGASSPLLALDGNSGAPLAVGGTLSSLRVRLNGAIVCVATGGNCMTMTLMKNNVATSLTCNVTTTSSSCSNLASTVSVAEGDVLSLRIVTNAIVVSLTPVAWSAKIQ